MTRLVSDSRGMYFLEFSVVLSILLLVLVSAVDCFKYLHVRSAVSEAAETTAAVFSDQDYSKKFPVLLSEAEQTYADTLRILLPQSKFNCTDTANNCSRLVISKVEVKKPDKDNEFEGKVKISASYSIDLYAFGHTILNQEIFSIPHTIEKSEQAVFNFGTDNEDDAN